MSSEDFLSRWSRRKLEIQRDEKAAPPASVEPEQAPAEEAEHELTPEEIAALPKIEDMTPETDLTLFLRKGVPELLKKAALRRMWSLDPAIRDYVGEAREYAYDWNVPGGVPGNGPLLPTDDVGQMLARVFGEEPARPERDPDGSSSQDRERQLPRREDEAERSADALSQVGHAESDAAPNITAGDEPPTDALIDVDRADEPPPLEGAEPERLQAVPRRRHGGAIPV